MAHMPQAISPTKSEIIVIYLDKQERNIEKFVSVAHLMKGQKGRYHQ